MNLHHHARLTPRGRARLVARILVQGLRTEEAAHAAGVSVRTAYKWLRRFKEEGPEGLADRSSRPHACPHATPRQVVDQVIEQRRSRQTYRQIAQQLPVAPSTIARLLRRAGLHRPAELEPAPPHNRYEYAKPGQLLHLDIKKLARFRKPGHRVTDDRTINSRGIGWEYVHLAIDDHSRVAFGAIEPDESGRSACRGLMQAVRYYPAWACALSACSPTTAPATHHAASAAWSAGLDCVTCARVPIRLAPTARPSDRCRPPCASGLMPAPMPAQSNAPTPFHGWLHHYNWHRPHASLGYQPPISRISLNNVLRLHT